MTTVPHAPAAPPTGLALIPLAQIFESPLNPRKHFDPGKLTDLTASMKEHGQLTPALVRPAPGGKYELAAGHRRFRAAKAAQLATLECKVRQLTDAQFAEILTIENDEREDVHPLEQADGYRLLMEKAGYDVAKIAARVQRGHDFVYDRLRLLKLTPALRELFLADRFGLSQALVLAKLSPDEQAKAARKPDHRGDTSGLWRTSGPTLDEKLFPLVAKSAAELEYWISRHLRFEPEKIELEELFPETAVALEAAAETETRVVSITREGYVQPSAKDEKDRTYTRDFWKRADGLEGSKQCEYAVVGIVRVGEHRGEAMGVCLRRDKCTVHWAAQVKAAAAREKAKKERAGGKGTTAAAASPASRMKQEAKERAAALKAKVEESRLIAAAGVLEAALAKLAEAPSKAVLAHARQILDEDAPATMPLEQLVVRCAIADEFRDLAWSLRSQYERKRALQKLTAWGLDPAKIIAGVQVETCVHCGCSEENACRLGSYGNGPSCKWVSTNPRVCSNPKCVALAKGEAPPKAAVVADDQPWDEESDDDDE